MSYYPEPDNHVRGKVKVVLVLLNYATKIKLDEATGVETCNIAPQRENEVDKLDINKYLNWFKNKIR